MTPFDDDRLLDALGRGETPDSDKPGDDRDDDRVVTLLAEWRAALPDTVPVPGPPQRRRGRGVRRSLVAAAVVLVAAGGVSAAAEHAQPDSPLWPVTRVLYGDLADSRAAGHAANEAVTVAAEATEGGSYDRATELLDRADALVADIDEPETVDHLRARIATIRARIATATNTVVPTPPVVAEPPPAPPAAPETNQGDTNQGDGPANDTGPGGGPGDRDQNGPDPDDRDEDGGEGPPGHGPPGLLPTVPVPIPVPGGNGSGSGR